jgi:hypothetical protein
MVRTPQTSFAAPAVAWFQNRFFIAWTGTDLETHLNLMSTTDMITFSNPVTLNETSFQTPALTVFQGRLYLAWIETDNTTTCLISSSDGINFSQKVTMNLGEVLAPSLAAFGNRLYLALTPRNDTGFITLTSSTNGTTFGDQITIAESSSAPPALLDDGREHLVLAWTARSTGQVNIAMLLPQGGMAHMQTLNEVSDKLIGPSLQVTENGFTVGYVKPEDTRQVVGLTGLSVPGENAFDIAGRVETTASSFNTPSFVRWLQNESQVSFVVWAEMGEQGNINIAPLSTISGQSII